MPTKAPANSSSRRSLIVLGVMMIGIGLLYLLSLLTFQESDYAAVSRLGIGDLLDPSSRSALLVDNWVGTVGAWLAHFSVTLLFGVFSVTLPVVLIGSGWVMIRDLSWDRWLRKVVLMTFWMLTLSTFAGWLSLVFNGFPSVISGQVGFMLASVMQGLLSWGTLILLLTALATLIFMTLKVDFSFLINLDVSAVTHWMQQRLSSMAASGGSLKKRASSGMHDMGSKQAKPSKTKRATNPGEEHASEPIVATKPDTPATTASTPQSPSFTDKTSSPSSSEPGTPSGGNIEIVVGQEEEDAGTKDLGRAQKAAASGSKNTFQFPPEDLLDPATEDDTPVNMDEIRRVGDLISDKLKQHNIALKTHAEDDGEDRDLRATVGPTVTLYEIEPEDHVKISRIGGYANDLKMATAAKGIRIIAPIPGKSAVGIEIPNSNRQMVHMRSMINKKKFVDSDMDLPIAFGKTIDNEIFMIDLARMPHLLIAGATGSGKSVGINTIITCLLYKLHPDNLKFVLIDPKKIELSLYRHIQNQYLAYVEGAEEPIVTDTSKALGTLKSVCKEMDSRYELLKMAMVRDIKAYNDKFAAGGLEDDLGHRHLPFIVVIIDELADLMMTAGRQIEEPISRIAQLARAVGIHLVIATQRPSVNVITGTIKANFPARIAYQVASKVDSRTILDVGGADELVGKGDMLFSNGAQMVRVQNAFVSTEEVEQITAFIGQQSHYHQPLVLESDEAEETASQGDVDDVDTLFAEAAKTVMLHQQGSVSLLQRKLKIGYNRAGRLIDQLFSLGVVGPYQGSAARDVLIETEEELQELLDEHGIKG
jgi:S-DNA-T family DNA segregation ATPase FtsK/SpoIIIE